MITKKVQRRYPDRDWDYKAICTRIDDGGRVRAVYYYVLRTGGVVEEGVEVYSGANYIVGAKDRSSSRNYRYSECPVKYRGIVSELRRVHRATRWSAARRVSVNET